MLGRAHYGHALRLPHEEHAIVFAPPRTGKSGLLADIMLQYPGPVLSTTTRADIFKNTQHARRGLGRVDVFNPQGIGRVPSTMAWDPISGCLDIATAIRRADAFALAVTTQGVEDGAFWAAKTSDYLRAFFYAAAFAQSKGVRYGLPTAARWALGGASQEAEEILTDAGALDWAAQVARAAGRGPEDGRHGADVHDPGSRLPVRPGAGQVGNAARRRRRVRPGELRARPGHAVPHRLRPG